MTLSHAIDINSNPIANPSLHHLGQQVNEFRERSRAKESFAILERDLHEAFAEAERRVWNNYSKITTLMWRHFAVTIKRIGV